jgi:hypothetical protein
MFRPYDYDYDFQDLELNPKEKIIENQNIRIIYVIILFVGMYAIARMYL